MLLLRRQWLRLLLLDGVYFFPVLVRLSFACLVGQKHLKNCQRTQNEFSVWNEVTFLLFTIYLCTTRCVSCTRGCLCWVCKCVDVDVFILPVLHSGFRIWFYIIWITTKSDNFVFSLFFLFCSAFRGWWKLFKSFMIVLLYCPCSRCFLCFFFFILCYW